MANSLGSSRTNNEELRIVMVGKTGIGKSATGNTILGRECFKAKRSATSLTEVCSKATAVVDGQQVAVIDTPGLFDTRCDMVKTAKDISQCIAYGAPGPHVFLVLIKVDRFTDEEKETVQRIQKIFGQPADRFSMIVFTHGDNLDDSIEEFLKESEALQELVARCNGQYHVLNNKLKDRPQVTELLQKIRNIVQKNGGSHYTNEMFQEAEKAIEEEKQRILKKKEEQMQKEKEKLEREAKEKCEKEMKKFELQLQAERERERKEAEKEMEKKRKRDREEREAEREREREEKEREIAIMRNKITEESEREAREQIQALQSRFEREARELAENSNPFFFLIQFFELIMKKLVEMFGLK